MTLSSLPRRALSRPHSLFKLGNVRHASTSDVAQAVKEKSSTATSQAALGLSRVTSTAGSVLGRVGMSAGGFIGGLGGRAERLVGAVQCKSNAFPALLLAFGSLPLH